MVITEDIGLDAAVEVVDDLPQGAVAYLEDLGKFMDMFFMLSVRIGLNVAFWEQHNGP